MAFVHLAKKETFIDLTEKNSNANIGPGVYDTEGLAHKQLMLALYPKKVTPFNASDARHSPLLQPSNMVGLPGPGAYEVGTDIVNTMNFRPNAPAEKGTYLINDNGHLNQRTQLYLSAAKLSYKGETKSPNRSPRISPSPVLPGPGSYETNVTAFNHDRNKISGPIICAPQNVQSPRERAAMFNPSLSKMTVPSIPSRFLTPVIDGQQVQGTTVEDQNEYCKMSRLINDRTKVGPGTYHPDPAFKMPPKSVIQWERSQSQRNGIDGQNFTQDNVGPGSYDFIKNIDTKPQTMSIARKGIAQNNSFRFCNGTIKDGFEEIDENDTNYTPGPGSYLSGDTSFIKKPRRGNNSLQQFGSAAQRFQDLSKAGTSLGPGQYKVRHSDQPSVFCTAGTSTFKAPERKGIWVSGEVPGPGEYENSKDSSDVIGGKRKKNLAFGVKQIRFGSDETLPPGPGQYKVPDSCQIRNAKVAYASYVSSSPRNNVDVLPGGDAPGVGKYNVEDHKTLSVQQIQGGAPNNFLLLTRNQNPYIRTVETNPLPRLPDTLSPTPNVVGPGSYLQKQKSPVADKKDDKRECLWGADPRFRSIESNNFIQGELPGPGSYSDVNKWNKRTYNLKFLNIKGNKTTELINQNSSVGLMHQGSAREAPAIASARANLPKQANEASTQALNSRS